MYPKFLIALFIITLIRNTVAENTDDEYNDDIYDPTARDFTERCNDLAQYAGPKACEVFNKCCSEDFSLNKLNGDRCQNPDHKNHCSLGPDGMGIGYSHCKAFNCTAEVTTTTTSTRSPFSGSPSSGILSFGSVLLAVAVLRI